MTHLRNAVAMVAGAQDSRAGKMRWGIVTSVDPHTYCAKVTLQPEGVQTDWLPILTATFGNGWGIVALPQQGQQVLCAPDLDSHESLVILGGTYNAQSVPPVPPNTIGSGGTVNPTGTVVQPGEMVLQSAAGGVLRLAADGSIYFRGTVRVDGNIVCNGDVSDRHGSMDRMRGNYNAHTHTQPPDGHGDAEAPTNTTSNPDPE